MAEKKKTDDVVERVYTIPLRRAFRHTSRYKKTPKAVRAVIAFLEKHFKSSDVKLGQHLNDFLWQHGIKNPPARVTVRAVKDSEGVVRAELEGKAFKESVRPEEKKEDTGSLKDRLTEKIAGPAEKKEGVKAPVPAATAPKKEDAKPAIEKKPATAKESKPALKPVAPAAKKEVVKPATTPAAKPVAKKE